MRRFAVVVALGMVLAARAGAAETPIPPPPDRWVTDRAGVLSAATVGDLDARLAAYERATGHQLVAYVDRTTGGVPIEDWAVRAFERWRVGRRGIDDGAVLFVFVGDRRARIEVGYGLEDRVPDARAARIIDERVVPRMRAGDADGAVTGAMEALMTAAGGGAGAAPGPQPIPIPGWALVLGGIVLVLLLLGLVTHPALAAWLLFEIGRGGGGGRGGGWGGGGGGWGGGGGFSGGGGRSGGGGASGSW